MAKLLHGADAATALRGHWPEYLSEAAGLALFMVSACFFGTVLEYPGSPLRQAIADPFWRRVPMGLAMGLTAVALVYSSWGRRSGAHLNPAVTLTFWRLGKLASWDALFYVGAQFVGGLLGVGVGSFLLGRALAAPAVRYVATLPGPAGTGAAFAAEIGITFVLMLVVLVVSNDTRWASWTGLCAAALVATSIVLEAPLSGMSMNPARTFGSAVYAGTWHAIWVYFTAPVLGMLLAAEVYRAHHGVASVRCAKLQHAGGARCIFRCGYAVPAAAPAGPSPLG